MVAPFIAKAAILPHDARMTRIFSAFVAPLAVGFLALGGCATQVPPVSVTRFHTDAVNGWAAGKTYVVDASPLTDTSSSTEAIPSELEWNSYRVAIERQLKLQGLVAASDNGTSTAALRVRIGLHRVERLLGGSRSPVSVGVGGSTGGYRSGVGLGIGINLGGGAREMTDIKLMVRIDDAASGQALWEGRAETAVPNKAPAAQPSLAAAKLAEALFKDFPGESGRTISVP